MTPNARWSMRVCELAHGRCEAQTHDPRCRLIGEHAHHLDFKAHIPASCYWVVRNGVWLSLYCHALAHKTHNDNIAFNRRRDARNAIREAIAQKFPNKPELLPPVLEAA